MTDGSRPNEYAPIIFINEAYGVRAWFLPMQLLQDSYNRFHGIDYRALIHQGRVLFVLISGRHRLNLRKHNMVAIQRPGLRNVRRHSKPGR